MEKCPNQDVALESRRREEIQKLMQCFKMTCWRRVVSICNFFLPLVCFLCRLVDVQSACIFLSEQCNVVPLDRTSCESNRTAVGLWNVAFSRLTLYGNAAANYFVNENTAAVY